MYDFEFILNKTRFSYRSALSPIQEVSIAGSTEKYSDYLSKYFSFESKGFPPAPYLFTSALDLSVQNKIKEKFGVNELCALTVLSSATHAICCALILFKRQKRQKIAIISPSYFLNTFFCDDIGISYEVFPVVRDGNKVYLSIGEILEKKCDGVLITSPLYGTNEYYGSSIKKDLEILVSKNFFIIIDEAMALPSFELIRKLPVEKNTFFIYSPHKSIAMNAFKFSVIISKKEYLDDLRWCSDVYYGGFNQTTGFAINHFLSSNFDLCVQNYWNYVNLHKKDFLDYIKINNWKGIDFFNGVGHYLTLKNNVPWCGVQRYLEIMQEGINSKGLYFFPPYPNWENGFRFNLLYENEILIEGLKILLKCRQ